MSEIIPTNFAEDDLTAARILLANQTVVEDVRLCQGRSGDTTFHVGVGLDEGARRHLERRLGWRR